MRFATRPASSPGSPISPRASTHRRRPPGSSRKPFVPWAPAGPARPCRAVLEGATEVWGRSGPASANAPVLPLPPQSIDEDAIRDAAKRLAAAKRPLIVAGGGAQDAATEVAELSRLLQAPVLAYRRG